MIVITKSGWCMKRSRWEFSQHRSKGALWRCGAKPLLGSTNTVQCKDRLGQVRSGQVRLGQVRLGKVRLGWVRLGQVGLGLVCFGQVRQGQVRLGQVRLGQVRLGQVGQVGLGFGLVRFLLDNRVEVGEVSQTKKVNSRGHFSRIHVDIRENCLFWRSSFLWAIFL